VAAGVSVGEGSLATSSVVAAAAAVAAAAVAAAAAVVAAVAAAAVEAAAAETGTGVSAAAASAAAAAGPLTSTTCARAGAATCLAQMSAVSESASLALEARRACWRKVIFLGRGGPFFFPPSVDREKGERKKKRTELVSRYFSLSPLLSKKQRRR
jgi:hypothetical protein